jgi:hypothetical protein
MAPFPAEDGNRGRPYNLAAPIVRPRFRPPVLSLIRCEDVQKFPVPVI